MRIIYDASTFGQQRYGGISRYFTEIIPRIAAEADCRVSVWMGLYVNRYGLQKDRGRFEHFGGFRRPFIRGTHGWAQSFNGWRFKRFARGVEFDIYHTTGYFEGDPRPGVKKRVITVHDMIHHRAPGFERVPRDWLDRICQRIRAADGVICISQCTRRDVIDLLGIDESKIAVIYHGSPARVEPSPGRVVAGTYIFFVGVRPAYKNFDLLVQAFAKLPEIRRTHELVLFGGQPLRDVEVEMIRSLGLSDRVRYLPGGDDAMLANLYTHAAAYVYPSLYEGFGLPTLEAFTYGCPAVCSNASSLPEIGGEAALYFDPASADDLAEKLARVIEDQSLRAKLVSAGTERLKQFSWDRCARETADFYRRLSASSS
jgi:glycosyltransferase involved in cell wall biosynthesis